MMKITLGMFLRLHRPFLTLLRIPITQTYANSKGRIVLGVFARVRVTCPRGYLPTLRYLGYIFVRQAIAGVILDPDNRVQGGISLDVRYSGV